MKKAKKDKMIAVWSCDFCGEEFKTKKESDRHEMRCKKNPKNKKRDSIKKVIIAGILVFLVSRVVFFQTEAREINGRSMLPTLVNKEILNFNVYGPINKIIRKPIKSDIVIFHSGITATEGGELADYVKRVIAVENDELEIRNGYVYINGQNINEPYTLKSRSTFGGTFLKECKKIKIPKDYVFVMGDNRKRSKDSRDIGLISTNDIYNYLPVSAQIKFVERQRDTSHDLDNQETISFDNENYYIQLNKIREENGLKPLKRNEKLEKAAIARAKFIIENNEIDIFTNDEESKYPFGQAIRDAGYSNILTGEISTTGYYDAEELSQYWMEYDTKTSVLHKQYQDTGIGAYIGKIDGCEIQVVVQEFGGYVPPNYSKATIESWRGAVNSLNSVIPSWEKAKGWNNINQDDLNKLLDLMYREKSIASNILSKMESGKWLTDQENKSIDEYENLSNQSRVLADKLNSN